MQLCILARHGDSTFNDEGRINGDPSIAVALSERGRQQAAALGTHLANVTISACVHTRFPRTVETAELALGQRSRPVPMTCEALLDDINVGELEGLSIQEYRAFKGAHARGDAFPGGESLLDAGRRYAQGLRRLAARPETVVLAVCHELPIRYALNGASGAAELERPQHAIANATPYLFEAAGLRRAADRIELLSR